MAGRILVIGATGTVGGHLVAQLEQLGEEVRAATREPGRAARRTGGKTQYVSFDLERPETFAPALDGADRVFLMARPGDEQADRVALPLIDEMKRQRIRHVVNLTAMGAEHREDFALRKVERYLEASGLGFTHLRPNFFMQIFSGGPLLQDLETTGALHIPAADAKLSFVDARDIAAMAVAALTGPGHAGKAYTLTGARALDHAEVARTLSEVAARSIQYVPLGEEEARQLLARSGLSPERIERLIGFYRLVRQGFCAPVSSDIETVLGRPPISFERFARDHASCWI
ncbi:SDR family oxidoreductase [Archangium lipolyticum]|uniref:SDR family oxidoreductase n=1 Tax=Archangium lipolyticum TaxID=2970465 RepID=UPI002149FAC1|nr:SDR family oxidoreductase [Archangium lipolyticum]